MMRKTALIVAIKGWRAHRRHWLSNRNAASLSYGDIAFLFDPASPFPRRNGQNHPGRSAIPPYL